MSVTRRRENTARIGVFGVGHHVYWPQFEGLLEELRSKKEVFIERVKSNNVETFDFGIIDQAQKAYEVLPQMTAANLDMIFCDMLTYATSSTFGIIIRELNIPVVLVALQPQKALNYSKASTYQQLCNDDICSLPEFTGVAIRMGKPVPPVIIGTLYDDLEADAEIERWCGIAKVLNSLKGARIGHFGHVLESMLDMHSDPTAFTAAFGCHIVQTEVDDLLQIQKTITDDEIEQKKIEILDMFDTPDPVSDPITSRLNEKDTAVAAKAAVTLDKFIEQKQLDGLAYYYEGEPGSAVRELVTNLIVGNSLITAEGIPMCGESDIKTCIAMLIMDRLGIGGSFAEFHPVDFEENFVLVGHDGPHHLRIADGKPVLRSLDRYHGKPGYGASVEFKIRVGPITILSIGINAHGRFKFVVAEGQSAAGPIPPTGNTNTRGVFGPDVRTFLRNWITEGPTHHFALGVGHHAQSIKSIADILGIECSVVQ